MNEILTVDQCLIEDKDRGRIVVAHSGLSRRDQEELLANTSELRKGAEIDERLSDLYCTISLVGGKLALARCWRMAETSADTHFRGTGFRIYVWIFDKENLKKINYFSLYLDAHFDSVGQQVVAGTEKANKRLSVKVQSLESNQADYILKQYEYLERNFGRHALEHILGWLAESRKLVLQVQQQELGLIKWIMAVLPAELRMGFLFQSYAGIGSLSLDEYAMTFLVKPEAGMTNHAKYKAVTDALLTEAREKDCVIIDFDRWSGASSSPAWVSTLSRILEDSYRSLGHPNTPRLQAFAYVKLSNKGSLLEVSRYKSGAVELRNAIRLYSFELYRDMSVSDANCGAMLLAKYGSLPALALQTVIRQAVMLCTSDRPLDWGSDEELGALANVIMTCPEWIAALGSPAKNTAQQTLETLFRRMRRKGVHVMATTDMYWLVYYFAKASGQLDKEELVSLLKVAMVDHGKAMFDCPVLKVLRMCRKGSTDAPKVNWKRVELFADNFGAFNALIAEAGLEAPDSYATSKQFVEAWLTQRQVVDGDQDEQKRTVAIQRLNAAWKTK